jgi:hypothetical protein
LRFSYAILLSPVKYVMTEKAGLLYLMQRALWFEDFPKSSMFSFIYQGTTASYEKTRLQMPLTNVTDCRIISSAEFESMTSETPARTGWWQQVLGIFKAAPSYFYVAGADETGQAFRYAFRDLDAPETWVQSVTALR